MGHVVARVGGSASLVLVMMLAWIGVTPGAFAAVAGITYIPTFGGASSIASGINSSGVVVGFSQDAAGHDRPFRFTVGGSPADLGTLSSPQGRAVGINDAGVITGHVYDLSLSNHRVFRLSCSTPPRSSPSPLRSRWC